MKKPHDLHSQLKVIEEKMERLTEMVLSLRAENAALESQNAQLNHKLSAQKSHNSETHVPVDQELFAVQVMQAKKIKREVEQTLRDAERKLEALRF